MQLALACTTRLLGEWPRSRSVHSPNKRWQDTAGHTKASFTQSWTTGWTSQSAPAHGRFKPPTCWSTVEHANHQTPMAIPSRRINYTLGPQRGIFFLLGGGGVCENSPATCRPSPGGPTNGGVYKIAGRDGNHTGADHSDEDEPSRMQRTMRMFAFPLRL